MHTVRKGFNLWIESFSGLSKEVWLLSFVTLINRSGSVIIIFLSLYLTEQLGFSKSQAGLVIGCYGIGAALGSFIGGFLTDKYGYYWVMFGSLFAVGFFFFQMAHVTEFYPFCITVILTSLVGDMYSPASFASVAAYSKPENHSRTLSLLRMAINLGFALGSAMVGIIAASYGYKWLFYLDGGTCILAAFFFLMLMQNKKEIPQKEQDSTIVDNPKNIRSPFRDSWFLLYMTSLALSAFAFMQLFSAYQLFAKEALHFNKYEYSGIMAFNGLLLFIFEMPIIHVLTQKKQEMNAVTIGAGLIGIAFFVFNIFGFYAWVAIVSMIFLAFGEILNFPFANSIALGRSHPKNRGRYMGIFSTTFSITFIVAPWLGMKIVELYGYHTLWGLMGVASMLGTAGLYFLSRKYK